MAKTASTRNPRIEALRLVAAASIAVFHTFMPWFEELTSGFGSGQYIIDNPVTCTALGFIDQLGSFGNNVFFLISGLFLIPACARASVDAGYWGAQARKTLRRAGALLASVALYTAAVLVLSATVLPIEDFGLAELPAILADLEFIWVYLLFIVLAPAIGWAWRRAKRPWLVVCALFVAVFCANGYIAFIDPGELDRGLLDWRKLMSAATYLVAFLTGGLLAKASLSRRRAGALLAASVGLTVAVEAALAVTQQMDLMYATSFKSTSILAFAMAAASVLWAKCEAVSDGKAAEVNTDGPVSRTVCRLAKSVLGFYILQALTSPLWNEWFYNALVTIYDTPGNTSYQVCAAGIGLSLLLLAGCLAIDQLARLPLFRKLGLAK